MEINRFKASDADEIVTWFTSLEDYVLWGGRTFGWPLETALYHRTIARATCRALHILHA